MLVLGRLFALVPDRPFVVVLGWPFVVVPVWLALLLPGRPGDAVLGWLLGLFVWLGAEVCAGALACGAGALGFGAGALDVFFWPQARAGTVITSK